MFSASMEVQIRRVGSKRPSFLFSFMTRPKKQYFLSKFFSRRRQNIDFWKDQIWFCSGAFAEKVAFCIRAHLEEAISRVWERKKEENSSSVRRREVIPKVSNRISNCQKRGDICLSNSPSSISQTKHYCTNHKVKIVSIWHIRIKSFALLKFYSRAATCIDLCSKGEGSKQQQPSIARFSRRD